MEKDTELKILYIVSAFSYIVGVLNFFGILKFASGDAYNPFFGITYSASNSGNGPWYYFVPPINMEIGALLIIIGVISTVGIILLKRN